MSRFCEHRPALQLHIEHPHAGGVVVRLAELERHLAGAVARRQPVAGEIVAHGLIQRSIRGVGDGIVRVSRYLSPHGPGYAGWLGRRGRETCRPSATRPDPTLPAPARRRSGPSTRVRQWMPISPSQPYAARRRHPAACAPPTVAARSKPGRPPARESPILTALDLGKAGVHRGVAHLPVDAAHRNVLGQDLVEHRAVLLRPQHPAARRQLEGRLRLRVRGDGCPGRPWSPDLLLFGPATSSLRASRTSNNPAGRPRPRDGTCLRKAPAHGRVSGILARAFSRSCSSLGMVSGVSVPTQVFTPNLAGEGEGVAQQSAPRD